MINRYNDQALFDFPILSPEDLQVLMSACDDETMAYEFMEFRRWGGVPVCIHCGDLDVYQMMDARTGKRNHRFLWRCRVCKRQYTVRIGTVLEKSRISLRHWCRAFLKIGLSRNVVNPMAFHRETGISYKSVLFLMRRIREAMSNSKSISFNVIIPRVSELCKNNSST